MSLLELASDIDRGDEGIKLMPHNQMLYGKVIAELNKGEHSIFYSEGTGLGKSFIFMKLVREFFTNCRVLYVVPKIAIWNNLTHYKEFEYISDRVVMATFATFNRYPNESISCADYDVVFIDECHHMLSDIQGVNVKQFIDDMISWDKYVFGMTATPEIEGVFVDEECFDVSCYGLDMFEAIEKGLMPKMDIAVGIKEDIDIPNNLREQYSIVGTKTLLETVIDDYKHVTHWLAYFTTKDELEKSVSELQALFPEFKILKAYHGLDYTAEVISVFETSKQPVILMTVSMFLEGMHLKNVGGVLLYRNVQKGHTYAQILGRLCVIGQKHTPVIVDVTGSIMQMRYFYAPKSSRVSESQRKVYERKDVFDITSRGYELLELATALERLRGSFYKPWEEWEDDIIRNHYPSEGSDIITRLPNRTRMAVSRRAYLLGTHCVATDEYTDDEIDILQKYGAIETVRQLSDRLPNRSTQSIRNKLADFGIEAVMVRSKHNWTEEEEEALLRLYGEYGPSWGKICEELGSASRQQVITKALQLGLTQTNKSDIEWSTDEDKLVIAYYGKDNKLLAGSLPNRTWYGIKQRARKLEVVGSPPKKWSDEEVSILRSVYPKYGVHKVIEMLPNRTCTQIRNMAHKLQITRDRGEKLLTRNSRLRCN